MSWRSLGWMLVAVVAVGFVGVGILPMFRGWERMNDEEQEVDIRAARERFTRYFCKVAVSQRVVDSELTRALPEEVRGAEPEWRMVNLFVGGSRVSPHFYYHGALSQIDQIELAWGMAKFSEEERRETALALVQTWQAKGNYFGGSKVVDRVWKEAAAKEQQGL